MKLKGLRLALAAVWIGAVSIAVAGEPVDKAIFDKLKAALEGSNATMKVESVETSEIPGLYDVQILNGPSLYSSADGSHFIVGDLYAVTVSGYVNLAEKRRDVVRAEQLAAVSTDDMIVFSPKGKTRAFINVFTDVTCFYCQKLHKEVPLLNERGVEVRYLAYPRAGVGSDGFNQMVMAWCADDKQGTLTSLKNKQVVTGKTCTDNPVAAQYKLGQELGVRGTPAIVTQDGKMIPGYQTADQLMVTLGLN